MPIKKNNSKGKKNHSRNSGKRGYGLPAVDKRLFTKKTIQKEVFVKKWVEIRSIDIYKAIVVGYSMKDFQKKYSVSSFEVLNKLRFL